MIAEFRLPDLGEGLPEAELVQWLVAAGDEVSLNQPIAEVETAKAVVDLPSPHAGRVRELRAQPGDVVAVGAVLISFEVDGPADDRPESAAEPATPLLVGYGAAARADGRPRRRARTVAAIAAGDTAVLEAAPHDVLGRAEAAECEGAARDDALRERPRSTPPVRAHAKQLGVDLALVTPSGDGELITRADVDAYAARVGAAPLAPAGPMADAHRSTAEGETRIPIKGVRRLTAEAMVRSAFTAPHATTFLTVDVTASMELLASLAADRARQGQRIGITALAAKAVCLALPQHPMLNARWDDEAGEIVQHHRVNLGIAAATERGLVVPNVRAADTLALDALAEAIGELTAAARAGRTAPAAMTGGTFTITNVGVFGVDAGTPILNPPEAGILALGAVRRLPWEHRGEIVLRDVVTLSLSFDHRLVDGEQGARFLAAVGDVLREPGRAMLLR
ncbi:dihydrolipoamide acetyltransferase family protein [Microbacterium fluvii]|uniref:Dihydrolipoamide acetyltransferase component of pyruvate dehydrogenase complex n=1 Tax=Microbacterium fluvii TaxID=415215 RepID=A0ABW2HG34_9MICO|nr:dihydrolipoamide acetyltransferase family protein [Microbacterium fluvii]MCU4672586.1 2-oxo acid dehydrogenase subunit E2 [Microbacterium fluvii]